MQENLVIVESPAKAKTIEKFLGKGYVVKSSFGHIRDLSKKELGIDIQNDFTPHYEISPDKKKTVAELEKLAKEAGTVWLASDEDREGEAIAWHLSQVLGLKDDKTKRIVFHEITKNAILHAIENPRTIDLNLVNAQQARRILDRLVGFELSPVLWKKIKPSLSAGRVQSVAVRLIVEREREIMDFKAAAYYRVLADFTVTDADGKKSAFRAELSKRYATEQEALALLEKCKTAVFTVRNVERKPSKKSPAAPFTTSTLQQEAGRKLGMSVSQTMSVAQRLYEAGYITYMRTDSVNLSGQAIAAAKAEIVKLFGEKYSEVRNYKTKTKGAQEAHEAIRPSYMDKTVIDAAPAEKRLYDLIWKRTIASQMAAAQTERTVVDIEISNAEERFVATGETVLFDGFLKLYSESTEDEAQEGEEALLPPLKQGDRPEAKSVTALQRFTQSPPRYSEASLVKRLEELGIGRPSTYAPTISTIITRGYVVKENREGGKRGYVQLKLEKGEIVRKELSEHVGKEKNKLSPTDIGMLVTDYLDQQFTDVMDYNFTAMVEKEFDEIAEGDKSWVDMIRKFYEKFHSTVDRALESQPVRSSQPHLLGTDPKSGKPVYVKIGRFGPVAQIGDADDAEKPRFASLRKGQLIASITLEEALDLFTLPRTVGEFEEKEVVIGIGRFGPYVRHDGKFVSLGKTDDPYTIELDRAVSLIRDKREKDAKAKEPIRTYPEDDGLQVLNGRYGPYIAWQGKNYRIPKGYVPADLTLEQCREIIAKSKK
ncbi:type I DNA topoisomerase [Alistipes sp. dk3620]|uniref:type I DNA topoisomerase n=2 Tax=Alistipes TaxID=239759 RepID=UPI000E4CFE8C|nr:MULTISPECIES: type I DNA topoisomerase [unclassified Alistipes]MQX28152.1 type I DNA topoisomerase [Alistipes sp. dk3620]QGA23344.1 type I DNA topoisomerase [Alistipes sp. dk3624]RHO72744.1 type I DNA topoisomerase [Alistipes sp. AF48-12]HIV60174.1 type I DNA topoisomerase [Candidatus Alistipes pullistercoris]